MKKTIVKVEGEALDLLKKLKIEYKKEKSRNITYIEIIARLIKNAKASDL